MPSPRHLTAPGRPPLVALCLLFFAAAASASGASFLDTVSTPLQDISCNMESVQAANDQQLHAVLQELAATPFFRLINVNMDGKCPYWGGPEAEEPACASPVAEPSAPPLCSLGADPPADPFGSSAFGAPGGFSSAPAMSSPVDATITPEEDAALAAAETHEDCSNEALPTFWLDMCSNIPTNASDYVNLQLNQESYTGYNGSHVWAAIYQENCLSRTGGHDDNICFEERVLYRLFSGMHAATNTHVARFYHAPSKRKNRTNWEPELSYYQRQFDQHPERIKNLHFAFVVLLRAVRRASPFLASYDYTLGAGMASKAGSSLEGQDKGLSSTKLVQRLLDSAILRSCSAVFDAFDESVRQQHTAAQQHSTTAAAAQQQLCHPTLSHPP